MGFRAHLQRRNDLNTLVLDFQFTLGTSARVLVENQNHISVADEMFERSIKPSSMITQYKCPLILCGCFMDQVLNINSDSGCNISLFADDQFSGRK